MRVLDRQITGACFYCGHEDEHAGDWYGHKGVVHLCHRLECRKQHFHLLIDSLHPDDLTTWQVYRTLVDLQHQLTLEFWRKMYLWARK